MPRTLAVIVVNFASHDLLLENLVPTMAGVPDGFAVVVDNFSSTAERDAVARACDEHDWTALLLDHNTGFGVGVNRGAAAALAAGATDLLLLNPDARIDGGDLDALAPAEGEASISAPLIVSSDGRPWFRGSLLRWADGTVAGSAGELVAPTDTAMPWLTGACLWITARAWELTGGFDDEYFLYWEDIDLSRRALDAGVELRFVPEARALHDAGGTQEQTARGKSSTYYYYNVRNRILFGARYLDDAGYARWRRSDLRVSWGILMRGGRRQLLRSPGMLGSVLRGIRDGRRLGRRIRAGG